MIETVNPTSGGTIAVYEEHTIDDLVRFVEQAHHRFLDWRRTSYEQRAGYLFRIAELLEQNADPLAELMAIEMGKPVVAGRAEAKKCAWVCRHYAENAARYLADQPVETEWSMSYATYAPLGIVRPPTPACPLGESSSQATAGNWPTSESASSPT